MRKDSSMELQCKYYKICQEKSKQIVRNTKDLRVEIYCKYYEICQEQSIKKLWEIQKIQAWKYNANTMKYVKRNL